MKAYVERYDTEWEFQIGLVRAIRNGTLICYDHTILGWETWLSL